MKKILFALSIVFCTLTPRLFSLDLKFSGGLGNLAFDNGRTVALSAVDGRFEPNFFPLALVQLSGEFRDLSYNIGFERDPLLRNRLFANVKMDFEYFFLEAGPVLGLFNNLKLPVSPGVSACMGLMIPGIIFVEAAGSSTVGILLEKTGNHFQRSGDISLGFWVPYVVCSLNWNVRNYTIREQTNLLIEDAVKRYYFRADVYTKNVPYTIRLDLGYQDLSRSYTSQKIDGGKIVKDTQTDEFKSIFLGLEGTCTIHPAIKIFLGGEIPVYSWGVRPMKDPPRKTFLFRAWSGLIWTLPTAKD